MTHLRSIRRQRTIPRPSHGPGQPSRSARTEPVAPPTREAWDLSFQFHQPLRTRAVRSDGPSRRKVWRSMPPIFAAEPLVHSIPDRSRAQKPSALVADVLRPPRRRPQLLRSNNPLAISTADGTAQILHAVLNQHRPDLAIPPRVKPAEPLVLLPREGGYNKTSLRAARPNILRSPAFERLWESAS